jgi:hypothetical protein
VNNSQNLSGTFAGNSTATGLITEADIPRLAIVSSGDKNTFTGTFLTTSSDNREKLGLTFTPSFTFTINQPDDDTGFVIPTNGVRN